MSARPNYDKRKFTQDVVAAINKALSGRYSITRAAAGVGMHAPSDRKWIGRQITLIKNKVIEWPPPKQSKKTTNRGSSDTNSSSSSSSSSDNTPIRNKRSKPRTKWHDSFLLATNREFVTRALNREITSAAACTEMGLPAAAVAPLRQHLWRIRQNKSKWPPETEDDENNDSTEPEVTAHSNTDHDQHPSTSAAPPDMSVREHIRARRGKCKTCKTSQTQQVSSTGLTESGSFELRTQKGKRSAFGLPANTDKTLFHLFTQSGRLCKGHRHLQCRCKAVFRMEVEVNGTWYLAKPHTGEHAPHCQTLSVYEVAREQAELERQSLVKLGIAPYKATETLVTTISMDVAERFGVDPERLLDELQPHYIAKRKMQKAATDKDLGNINLNNPPDLLKHLPGPLSHYSWFLGPPMNDDEPQPDVAVYAAEKGLRHLADAKCVVLDGTFKTAPKGYLQVLIAHAAIDSSFSPVIYAFMRNKTRAAYELVWNTVFERMMELKLKLRFKHAVTDFELGLRNGFRYKVQQYFPDLKFKLRGCSFHWTKNLMKRVADKGLRSLYQHNPDFKEWYRSVMAVLNLAPKSVCGLWRQGVPQALPGTLRAQMTDEELENTHQLLDEIYNYYIGPTATFPPIEWSQWLNFDKRTTNVCEGFHSLLRRTRAPENATTGRALLFFQRRHLSDLLEMHWINTKNRPREPNALYEGVNQGVKQRTNNYIVQATYLLKNANNYELLRSAWHQIADENTPPWLYEHARYTLQRMIDDDEEFLPYMPENPTVLERTIIIEVSTALQHKLVIKFCRAMGFMLFDPARKGAKVEEEVLRGAIVSSGQQQTKPGQKQWRALGRQAIAERRQAAAVTRPPQMSRRSAKGRQTPVDPSLLVQMGSHRKKTNKKANARKTLRPKKPATVTAALSSSPTFDGRFGYQTTTSIGDPTGFRNPDDRCYFISTLQALICSAVFRDEVSSDNFLVDPPTIRHLRNIIRLRLSAPELKTNEVYHLKMEVLTRVYGEEEADRHTNTQEDALEALNGLLAVLDDSRSNQQAILPWHFLHCENRECSTCHQQPQNRRIEQNNSFQVTAAQAENRDLQHAVQNWAHEYEPSSGRCVVSGNDACNSERWQSKNRLHSLPRLLIVNIKRQIITRRAYNTNEEFQYIKDRSPVHLNPHLQMGTACDEQLDGSSTDYDLISAVRHDSPDVTTVMRGHYYAYAMDDGQWRKFNNERVTGVSEQEMLQDCVRDAVAAIYIRR